MSQAVVAVFNRHVPRLKKGAGAEWTGFCPIHDEDPTKSKPSFGFNEDSGLWVCRAGCGAGSLRRFLAMVGVGDMSADAAVERVRHLLVRTDKAKPTFRKARFTSQDPLPRRMLGLFDPYLSDDLLYDGFSEKTLRDNDVGFDTHHMRITYPIYDVAGQIAGLVGKPVGRYEEGKYRVYTKSDLEELGYTQRLRFDRSHYLWRMHKVAKMCRDTDDPPTVIIVEGYKAALWMVQNGWEATLALQGSSISDEQLLFLQRLGCDLILFLDNDRGGWLGTSKIGYKLRGVPMRVATYPYKDARIQPDDLTQQELLVAIQESRSLHSWRREYGLTSTKFTQRTQQRSR